jgi:hypothetical protein
MTPAGVRCEIAEKMKRRRLSDRGVFAFLPNVDLHLCVSKMTARQSASRVSGTVSENGKQACEMIRLSRIDALRWMMCAFLGNTFARCDGIDDGRMWPSESSLRLDATPLKCPSCSG